MCQLHIAVREGRPTTLKLLIDGGGDIGKRDGYGDSLLHTAVRFGNPLIINILIRAGVYINTENKEGQTPLRIAEYNFREWGFFPEVPNLLKQAGAK